MRDVVIDNFFSEFFESVMDDHVFLEKKTQVEYRMEKFKKKYHYDPQKKTINVNGETYRVDLNTNKKTIEIVDKDGNKTQVYRQTMAELNSDDPVIYLDENFFKLKNAKRQDAVLQHEIGHTKLHNMNSKNPHLDTSNISPEIYLEILQSTYKEAVITAGYKPQDISSSDKRIIIDALRKQLPEKDQYVQKMSKDQLKVKMRQEMIQILKKYEKNSASHANFKEFEADRYAANRTSKKDLKKGVREYAKKATTDKAVRKQLQFSGYDDTDAKLKGGKNSYVDVFRKQNNKQNTTDYNQRAKALNDKKVEASKVYK